MTAADFPTCIFNTRPNRPRARSRRSLSMISPADEWSTTILSPPPCLLGDEGVQSLDGVSGILFLQQPDGAPWKILVHEPSMIKEVVFDFPEEEFRKMLADNAVILPVSQALPPYRLSNPPRCENFRIRGIFCVFRLTKPISGCII